MINIKTFWDTSTEKMSMDLGVIQSEIIFLGKTNHYSLWVNGELMLNDYAVSLSDAMEIVEDHIDSLLSQNVRNKRGLVKA